MMPDTRRWHFYVIALAPDLHPNRVKFGISHATAAPTAELLYTQETPNPARVYEHLCILAVLLERWGRPDVGEL